MNINQDGKAGAHLADRAVTIKNNSPHTRESLCSSCSGNCITDGNRASETEQICFHCGEMVHSGSNYCVLIDGNSHPVCSAGCRTVVNTITHTDVENYPQKQVSRSVRLCTTPVQPSSGFYDEPEIQSQYTATSSSGTQATLLISGLHCGACVSLLEKSVGNLKGIKEVVVNLTSSRMEVRYDPALSALSTIIDSVESIGYHASPYEPNQNAAERRQQKKVRLKQLTLAGLVAMQSMMFALPGYLSSDGSMELHHTQLFQWASFALTIPVLLYSARPFWSGAWRSIKSRRPGMDVPVAIALVCAATASLHAMFTGNGEVYFDSIAMFVCLLLGARYLEWSIRHRSAETLEALDRSVPQTARLLGEKYSAQSTSPPNLHDVLAAESSIVPAVRLKPGDMISVHSGERIAADSVVVAGRSSIDCSLISGESEPVPVSSGQSVPGGAVNCESPLVLRVNNTLADSALSTIRRLVNRGANEKPPLIKTTDRIATVFVSALLLIAFLSWLVWLQIDPQRALPIAIAVLVVSCPCALSLATPATLAAVTSGLLQRNVLVTHGHTVETLNRITDVVFDKTGTLTQGRPALAGVTYASTVTRDQTLKLAAHLEQGASHPIAQALIVAGESLPDTVAGLYSHSNLQFIGHCTGAGVLATLKDNPLVQIQLGTAVWCGVTDVNKWRGVNTEHLTEVFLVAVTLSGLIQERDKNLRPQDKVEVLARFCFEDSLKPGARELVEYFHRKSISVHLLSGDRCPVVTRVGAELGLALQQITGGATPADKQVRIKELQNQGKTVLMIGDGINDAPVLASADVSVAFGNASALACISADAVVLNDDVREIEVLVNSAERASDIIRQNLCWAAGYNLLAIPLAAFGMVPPWLAAVGMSASSLLVASNALRAAKLPGQMNPDSAGQTASSLEPQAAV